MYTPVTPAILYNSDNPTKYYAWTTLSPNKYGFYFEDIWVAEVSADGTARKAFSGTYKENSQCALVVRQIFNAFK